MLQVVQKSTHASQACHQENLRDLDETPIVANYLL